jgi:hypothetical protein
MISDAPRKNLLSVFLQQITAIAVFAMVMTSGKNKNANCDTESPVSLYESLRKLLEIKNKMIYP